MLMCCEETAHSLTRFRMVPKSVTVNNLERRNSPN